MADHPGSRSVLGAFVHRILDHLTAMKLWVGRLRVRQQQGPMTPEEIESHLDDLEQVIDAAATLAHDRRGRRISSSS